MKITISQTPLTKKPDDQIKVRGERWRTKLKSGYTVRNIPFGQLHRVVQSDYRTYSAGEFKDNYAKNENWIGQDLVILDIDDGTPTFEEAKELFKDFKAFLHTSASHQKEKGGVKQDRYRVILQADKKIDCSTKEYTDTMKFISLQVFPFIDKKCVDPARIYFGHFNSEYHYTEGAKLFSFWKHFEKNKQLKQVTQELKPPTPVRTEYKDTDNLIAEFNLQHTVEEILERNHYKKQGNRYVSPNSSTGMAGVVISTSDDGKTWAYNHHSSDEWENEDSFGIFAILEHGGNKREAYKAIK